MHIESETAAHMRVEQEADKIEEQKEKETLDWVEEEERKERELLEAKKKQEEQEKWMLEQLQKEHGEDFGGDASIDF